MVLLQCIFWSFLYPLYMSNEWEGIFLLKWAIAMNILCITDRCFEGKDLIWKLLMELYRTQLFALLHSPLPLCPQPRFPLSFVGDASTAAMLWQLWLVVNRSFWNYRETHDMQNVEFVYIHTQLWGGRGCDWLAHSVSLFVIRWRICWRHDK